MWGFLLLNLTLRAGESIWINIWQSKLKMILLDFPKQGFMFSFLGAWWQPTFCR